MAAKKILMLVGDYAENYEIMAPFQALQVVDHQVHTMRPGGWAGRSVHTAIRDSKGDQTYSEKPGRNFTLNTDFAQAHAEDYDALLISGGHAPERLRLDEQVLAPVHASDVACKSIAAVCHGIQLLAATGALQERACSTYPVCAPEVWLAGGEYIDIPPDQAHVNGHPVTMPAWPAHPAWPVRFFEVLGIRINH